MLRYILRLQGVIYRYRVLWVLFLGWGEWTWEGLKTNSSLWRRQLLKGMSGIFAISRHSHFGKNTEQVALTHMYILTSFFEIFENVFFFTKKCILVLLEWSFNHVANSFIIFNNRLLIFPFLSYWSNSFLPVFAT